MFDVLYHYITKKIAGRGTLTPNEFEIIKQAFIPQTLLKKHYFLQQGDVLKHHAFVCKGCLRMYRTDDKGREYIMQFAVENWWAGDRESIISGRGSKYTIDALEDSALLVITKEDFENLAKQIPALNILIQILNENNAIATQNRIHATISYSAEERYLDFLNTYPDLFNRLSQQMIASYLGIKRETLSRIRKQNLKAH